MVEGLRPGERGVGRRRGGNRRPPPCGKGWRKVKRRVAIPLRPAEGAGVVGGGAVKAHIK